MDTVHLCFILKLFCTRRGNNTVYYVRSATSEPLSCICALLFFNKAGARSVCPVPQMKHGLLWRQRIRNEAEKKRTKQGHRRWVSCRGIFLGSITAACTRLCLFWREADHDALIMKVFLNAGKPNQCCPVSTKTCVEWSHTVLAQNKTEKSLK